MEERDVLVGGGSCASARWGDHYNRLGIPTDMIGVEENAGSCVPQEAAAAGTDDWPRHILGLVSTCASAIGNCDPYDESLAALGRGSTRLMLRTWGMM